MAIGFVDFDDGAAYPQISRSRFQADRNLAEKTIQRKIRDGSDDRIVRPGHPEIRYIGGPARKNAFVRGLNMRVGSHDGADAPVKIPADGLFFRSGFRMKIDDDDRSLLADVFHGGKSRRERDNRCWP